MSCSYSSATAARVRVLRQPEVVGPEAGQRWSGPRPRPAGGGRDLWRPASLQPEVVDPEAEANRPKVWSGRPEVVGPLVEAGQPEVW